jgi:hypothetical protein
MDLGKAVAINPSQPANFYLRGDCHLKLGNYEQVRLSTLYSIFRFFLLQALFDFDAAERKGFQDFCSLALSRGVVKRLLKDYQGAIKDFMLAYDHLDSSDRVGVAVGYCFMFTFLSPSCLDWKNSCSFF